MTNSELRKKAQQIWISKTGVKIGVNSVTLLEADMDGKYIFFKVGKLSMAYYNRLGQDQVAMYPDCKGVNGMIV